MLLVKKVSGPARARVGTTAVYRAIEFNDPNPSPDEKGLINWVVKSDGDTVMEKRNEGEDLHFEIPESLTSKTIRVMPFRNRPTPNVSVVTKIENESTELLSPKIVQVEREGQKYYARVNDGPRFYVATDVRYGSRRGLMNTSDRTGQRYHPDHYRDQHGFWADFIYPTALCESRGYFQRINTYDRARFTFGFFQYAAHEPNANFVLLLREFLNLPGSQSYFPDLILREGAVHRQTEHGILRLETPDSTGDLMNYLNPSGQVVDQVEAINAAKIIHWSLNDPKHRECQVDFTIKSIKKNMKYYARRYGLHGIVDTVCMVVTDIRHQGRARSRDIIEALESVDTLGNLLRIGEDAYPERISTLRTAVDTGVEDGVFGWRKYDLNTEDFIPL